LLLLYLTIFGVDIQAYQVQAKSTTVDLPVDSMLYIDTTGFSPTQRYDHLYAIAYHYWASDNNDTAGIYALACLELTSILKDDKRLADALLMSSRLELTQVKPRDKVTKNLLKCLELYKRIGDGEGAAACNMHLGVLSYEIQNYSEAHDYFKEAIRDSSASKNVRYTVQYLIAICLSEIGEFEQSEVMFDVAKSGYGARNDEADLMVETFRGKLFNNRGDYQKAMEHLHKIIGNYPSIKDTSMFGPSYAFLSTSYYHLGDLKNTIRYGRLGYQLCRQRGAMLTYVREIEENLHRAYFQMGNRDSAYYFLNQLTIIRDSISNDAVLQRIAQMKGRFEFEQLLNQQQIEQDLKDAIAKKNRERERLLRNLLLIGFILLIIVAFVILRARNKVAGEKRRSDTLLLNILPAEIAEELKTKGKADARNFNVASILFTDFKEFTQTSEKLSAKELVEEIHTCFEAFDAICGKYNIEKIKTIGDAYMAAGGLPVPTEDSVKNTVLAAVEMQEFILARSAESEIAGKLAFEMRVGVHTGPVVAGIVGVKKFQYDIWGDTVNTASRMESNGEAGRVNISRATYELIKHERSLPAEGETEGRLEFEFESRGKIQAKGKGEVEMYFVSRSLRHR